MNQQPFVVAVDFDGTVVEHDFPKIGSEVPNCVQVMKKLIAAGHKIVLNTMRSDSPAGNFLSEAVDWFNKREIDLYGININPLQREWTNSPKVYANLYIDDAALGAPLMSNGGRPFVNWQAVEELLNNMTVFVEPIIFADETADQI